MSGVVKHFPWGNLAVLNFSCVVNDTAGIFMHAKFSFITVPHWVYTAS